MHRGCWGSQGAMCDVSVEAWGLAAGGMEADAAEGQGLVLVIVFLVPQLSETRPGRNLSRQRNNLDVHLTRNPIPGKGPLHASKESWAPAAVPSLLLPQICSPC